MPTIKLRSHIGSDGILHLDIPSDFKETEVNVTVTLEAVKEVSEVVSEAEPKKFYWHLNNENNREKTVCIVHLSCVLWFRV